MGTHDERPVGFTPKARTFTLKDKSTVKGGYLGTGVRYGQEVHVVDAGGTIKHLPVHNVEKIE